MGSFVTGIDVLFKISLAVIAAYVSYQFSALKQQNDDIKLVVELAFDGEARTATAGVVLAGKYAEQERIPAELYASIVASANSSGNAALRETANNSADAVAQTNEVVAQQVTQALEALPVRVYFHISREVDRAKAGEIEDLLQEQGRSFSSQSVIVPGIQFINQPKSQTEVRCFKKEECAALGGKLVEFLDGVGMQAKLVDLSDRYGTSKNIRPNHFEIWFAALS
ncbi:hypothetical protein [Sinorhizobium fredii]|uniref:Uncharacterized protein n=1 Tax=Rhizobium fredii TaxID=380 RepID=A0A2L0HA11_RHIFR|nr:hypothetical protein [Sinorhizobium fredii]AUX78340.1 hypothetical protein NXT3_PA00044 [Sinorhizobium fredii]